MGWYKTAHPDPSLLFPGVEPGECWWPPDFEYHKEKYNHSHGLANGISFPEFSTDIAAAWGVVEKLRDDNFSIEENGTHWKVRFGPEWAGALTAPLAICIASLRSKGINVNEWED